jgi:hypothetical protein
MLKLIIMTEEQRLPTMDESKAMYQIGPNKIHIVENEMMRHRDSIRCMFSKISLQLSTTLVDFCRIFYLFDVGDTTF